MSSSQVFWKWSAIGFGAALFLVWVQVIAVNGVAGLLQVGETSALRELIEAQLGPVPLADGPGHDGQIFYAIGLDLAGDEVGPLLDHAAYRYRRILFPLVASFFGMVDGWVLLYGMVAVGVVSMAASAGIVASMATKAGKSELLALGVVLNPGVWLSVQLLTSDSLALALMLAGLYSLTTLGRTQSVGSFALSGLAKDVSLATPIPLGARARDWRTILLPLVVLLAWMTFLTLRFGDGFASRGNLDWPFVGMIEASSNWANFDSTEWVYLVFAVASVAVGIVFSFRRSWLQWPIVAWTGLAIVSSNWVWDFGNNAARSFAPIVVLVALSGVSSLADGRTPDGDRSRNP